MWQEFNEMKDDEKKMMKVIDSDGDEGDERLTSTTNKTWRWQQQEPEANTSSSSSIFRILCDSWGVSCFLWKDSISWRQQQTNFSLLFMSRFSSLASLPTLPSSTRNAKTGTSLDNKSDRRKRDEKKVFSESLKFCRKTWFDWHPKRKWCLSYNVFPVKMTHSNSFHQKQPSSSLLSWSSLFRNSFMMEKFNCDFYSIKLFFFKTFCLFMLSTYLKSKTKYIREKESKEVNI